MAIQFACPSCREPIEIDDEWAGQAVSCPYCRHVVNAPTTSTWTAARPPTAAPVTSLPRSIEGGIPAVAAGGSGGSPRWALTLAITGCLMCCLAYGGMVSAILGQIIARAGPDATQEQLQAAHQEYMKELIEEGRLPVGGFVVACTLIGTCCSLAGLILAVRALLRPAGRKAAAVVACVLSACFLMCQALMMLALAESMPHGP